MAHRRLREAYRFGGPRNILHSEEGIQGDETIGVDSSEIHAVALLEPSAGLAS